MIYVTFASVFICGDRDDSNCKWLRQLLASRTGCIMFLVRQLYLEQIYGIVVTATLAACALTGTFVTCYCATAYQRLLCGSKLWPTYLYIIQQDEGGKCTSSNFTGGEGPTSGHCHLLLRRFLSNSVLLSMLLHLRCEVMVCSGLGHRLVTIHSCGWEDYKALE